MIGSAAHMASSVLPITSIQAAFEAALAEARRFEGATAPNPPVGAAALDSEGKILSVQAHRKAGTPHAEAAVIEDLRARGELSKVHTLVVTLEPCNHHGRTPPCSEAIIAAGIKRVIAGCMDPNPKVAGGGAERLRSAGLDFRFLGEQGSAELGLAPLELSESVRASVVKSCELLIAPFAYRQRTGFPWVTVKQAISFQGSMFPAPGLKTFTSESSLILAHELRKRSDAILTGSGTVISDRPLFTVRRVPDHPGKRRWLVVMDRRRRVETEIPDWCRAAGERGFDLKFGDDLEAVLKDLSEQGVTEVLLEAGPSLTEVVLQSDFWCRHVLISQGNPSSPESQDHVKDVYRHY